MTDAPVFVGADAVRRVFTWNEAVRALQAAYSRPLPPAAIPPRTVAREGGSWLRTLPAIPPGGRYFGAKLMGMNVAAVAPGVDYVIVLFDRETSRIAAFVDANMVTAYRTAATSAAALDRLVPNTPLRLAVLGSGLEASMHTRAFASVREIEAITVFSPTPARRSEFADTLSGELGVPVRALSSAEEAVGGASLVLAAARAHKEQPILYAEWMEPGAAVVSIGSTVPEQREIDVSVVARADLIICDMLDEVLHETGDMIAARTAGLVLEDKVFGLADLMSGSIDPRVNAAAAPMFKSVGGGLQDIVVAELILSQALEQGLATPLPIAFENKH